MSKLNLRSEKVDHHQGWSPLERPPSQANMASAFLEEEDHPDLFSGGLGASQNLLFLQVSLRCEQANNLPRQSLSGLVHNIAGFGSHWPEKGAMLHRKGEEDRWVIIFSSHSKHLELALPLDGLS